MSTAPVIPATMKPVSEFGNSALRDSINAALADVPAGHGRVVLDIENKGAGVMVLHRFGDEWALAAGARIDFEDRGISATLQVSW